MKLEKAQFSKVTFDQVESWYRQGIVSQEEFEHYCYHWRNEAPRFSILCQSYKADVCPFCGEGFRQ
jgi:hypothetical protein